MNEEVFIRELSKVTGYDVDKCTLVNEIMASHFLFGKKNKDVIINDFVDRLSINNEEADRLYETIMDIFKKSIKDKETQSTNINE